MSSSPSLSAEKKHWWLSNRKVVDNYLKDARCLIASQNPSDVSAALGLLDAALAISPRMDTALELKARSLLFLRRFKEVADLLQDYIPSFKMVSEEDSSTSLGSSDSSSYPQLSRERVRLLSTDEERSDGDRSFRCFSVSDLKRKVLAGLCGNGDKEGPWRYLVLGQACFHLGLMEDAMVLLQTGRRLATAAFRRQSICWSDDSFYFSDSSTTSTTTSSTTPPPPQPLSELDSASHLLTHIKLFLRRRTAALAALDAGLPSESIRHFSKILDNRRGTPHTFAAVCLIGRAAAYQSSGRLAESIADCNRALALDPSSIPALRARADLLESVRSLPDCLRDLDHLKLLYDSILRDRKLPGPAWRPHHDVRYRDIPSALRALNSRVQELRLRVGAGEGSNVDYYALIGVRRGCSRSELERAHLLLSLRHKPDKAVGFVDRLEFADDHRDPDSVRDQARMSAMILYRLLQKAYSNIMGAIMDEEVAEKERMKEAAAAKVAATAALQVAAALSVPEKPKLERNLGSATVQETAAAALQAPVFQGVFCRDMAVVGSLLSQVGFNRSLPVKYEGLSC